MILVTGASGYVGNNLVRRLVKAYASQGDSAQGTGNSIRALVGNTEKARLRLSDVLSKVEIVQGDVTKPETLVEPMQGVDCVIHLVAIAIEHGNRKYEPINTQGTINVVEAARKAGVKRFVNMSQNGASPSSPSRFLRSKGVAQAYVAKSDLDWTAVRPSLIWGPQDEFANVQARLIKLTPIIFPIPGDGKAQFQPIYVGDVVEAIARTIDDPSTYGQEYALGGPEVLTYEEIVRRVLKALGTSRTLIHLPLSVMRPIVGIMQAVLPNPPATTTLLELLTEANVVGDNALISKFGITPKPFTPENLGYMRSFSAITSLGKFLGRSLEEDKVRQVAAR